MNLEYLKQPALDSLKANILTNIENYGELKNDWILNQFDSNPFSSYKRDVPEFELCIDDLGSAATEIKNVKIFYSNLREISPTEATEERLWSGLAHGCFWEFMQLRFPKTDNANNINTHYFLGTSSIKRALITNTLARYWWVGHLVYDENSTDPYWALGIFKNDFVTRARTLFSSNYSSNKRTILTIAEQILKYESKNEPLNRDEYFSVIRYVNLLGGTFLLDAMPTEKLSAKIADRLHEIDSAR